jgi:RNA polymerase sigma-70 factor (ECF subfamily)
MFARLSEYIDNELDEITCRDIERHIANCPPCQVCLATLKRTVAICENLKDQPVPKDFSKKLKDMIDNL